MAAGTPEAAQAALRFFLLGLAILVAGGCAYLAEKQGELIFRPTTEVWRGFAGGNWNFEEHWIDGRQERRQAPRLVAARRSQPNAPVMLYLHGARWNLSGSVTRIDRWKKLGFSVLAVDYRGFGKSAALSPTEELAYEDAEAAYDYLGKLAPGKPRVVVGHSLGGAIAAELARRRPDVSGVVLEATFTSIKDMIAQTRLELPAGGPDPHPALRHALQDRRHQGADPHHARHAATASCRSRWARGSTRRPSRRSASSRWRAARTTTSPTSPSTSTGWRSGNCFPSDMEWLADPTIWVGLMTLIVLEIVLGIDNLIFIAILADKLPPHQRDRARVLGLALALIMRLGLLASISWIMSLTTPLFSALGKAFSWRDVILIGGGAFLIVKATIEIHDRLEAPAPVEAGKVAYAVFWQVVVQIVVLDAVFSLDSVITAIGMVDELSVMMTAVVIAMVVMLVASKPLTTFINAHPTLIILCLGFLLMVGFVLVADGLGLRIPKGYLYAAIGFSVLIEVFNQLALRNRRKAVASMSQRPRIADAVLRLLAGVPMAAPAGAGVDGVAPSVEGASREVFAPAEKDMVREVLTLATRPVQSIMTPRSAVRWIHVDATRDEIMAAVRESPHRQFVVGRDSIDEVVGIARKDDILKLYLDGDSRGLASTLHPPAVLRQGASILEALNLFKSKPVGIVLVVDERGGLLGIVTQTDVLEAIAGDLPDP